MYVNPDRAIPREYLRSCGCWRCQILLCPDEVTVIFFLKNLNKDAKVTSLTVFSALHKNGDMNTGACNHVLQSFGLISSCS